MDTVVSFLYYFLELWIFFGTMWEIRALGNMIYLIIDFGTEKIKKIKKTATEFLPVFIKFDFEPFSHYKNRWISLNLLSHLATRLVRVIVLDTEIAAWEWVPLLLVVAVEML